jgi:hypothetical protein
MESGHDPHPVSSRHRLAVLIDADNASHRIGGPLEAAASGEASVRRIYGDFSGRVSQPISSKHAIIPQQISPIPREERLGYRR